MKTYRVVDDEGAQQDALETQEWLESLDAVATRAGKDRAVSLLRKLEQHARELGLTTSSLPYSAYRNTVSLDAQGPYPGNLELEERLTAVMRWNALVMVLRANQAYGELGGHIASYASSAELFETGFHHFFRGPEHEGGADLLYAQPHSAPGIYARAYLEGRLSEEQLAHFRREVGGRGLCSYPHPWLMPDFWQFPTGSMGLGPISAVYQARFMRYLQHRKLIAPNERHVWGIFGDGEMDEPESIAGLTLAARERLDNLTFIINCNLQRLDGPVRGNGQIIRELESLFAGAGWNVIKVIWGSEWDALFARDHTHALLRRLASTVDGAYQTLGANDARYNFENFFKQDPQVQALVAHMNDQEIDALKRGGHDFRKLYAAFSAARAHPDQPTVILAKSKKGYGMGGAGESRMTAHQTKKLDIEAIKQFRDRFRLPVSDEDAEQLRFYRPDEESPEMHYLRATRLKLGGSLPVRHAHAAPVPVPPLRSYGEFALQAAGKEMSTTMGAVRLLGSLLRDKVLGPRIVPIVADEARTFGMASLFRQIGIYSPDGQLYEPEDASSMLSYRESVDGQLLEEGITEAGAMSSWIAAGTAYSVHGTAMLPVYIFYSMFGFQRVGDLIWAAADQRTRGFLFGATAGRTTLGGEGLQHQDGSSHIMSATVPNCRSYDPAFVGELAVIFDHGARQMLERQVDEFYYVTLMNENYPQPSLPVGVEEHVIRGMYRFSGGTDEADYPRVCLLGSGAILLEVIAAAKLLESEWSLRSEVYSVTSFGELSREAASVERWNRLHPSEPRRRSHVQEQLAGAGVVVAASDYVRAYPQLIGPYLDARYVCLGTDGFGRSDTRHALRRFFEVDRHHIVLAVLEAMAGQGRVAKGAPAAAIARYSIDVSAPEPWGR